jgi:hypothetical protein
MNYVLTSEQGVIQASVNAEANCGCDGNFSFSLLLIQTVIDTSPKSDLKLDIYRS